MKLIIAEKPQLASVIAEAIGIISREDGYIECKSGYIVTKKPLMGLFIYRLISFDLAVLAFAASLDLA